MPLHIALARLQQVAPTDSTVLLLGETGTGKELFARAVHAHSRRQRNNLVSVNCAALPPTLIESELFGHERGAFTGASADRQGRFELAHGGTIFLDEIGDFPLELQAKLLRVLQNGEFERVGSSRTRKVDVRIIAATHRHLEARVATGEFRADLYYRLSVFPIRLPPLREHPEDIPELVWAYIQKRQQAIGRTITHVPPTLMQRLQAHAWPGNVRELENVIERALIHSSGDAMDLLDDLEPQAPPADADTTTLSSVERKHIQEVLRECDWRINGNGNAAEQLGLHPNTLRFRMKKLGINRSRADARVRLAAESRLAEVLNRDRSRRLHHASLDSVPLGAMPDRHDVPIVFVKHIPSARRREHHAATPIGRRRVRHFVRFDRVHTSLRFFVVSASPVPRPITATASSKPA